MSSVNQKIPLQQSLNRFAERKVDDGLIGLGRQFPCHVTAIVSSMIVTVAFDVDAGIQTLPTITVPVFGPEYIRYPIQVGDKGFLISADVSLGKTSGLAQGTGTPNLVNPGNMTALVFMPIGNTNWFSVDQNVLFMYGPHGVEITTSNRDCTLTLSSSGISINLNGGSLNITNGNVNITGNVSTTGTLTNNGHLVGSTHVHSGVTPGGGNTGTPT